MPTSNPTLEYVPWRTVHLAVASIAEKIMKEYPEVDLIYSIVKGGLVPSRLLADILGIGDMGFIGVRFYKDIGARKAKPELYLPPTRSVRDRNVLVVDDVADSGRTLQLVLDELIRYGASNVKSAILYVKPWSMVMPDYYYTITENWVVFPWEIAESYSLMAEKEVDLDGDTPVFEKIGKIIEMKNKPG
jgi:hypoxanthine phosphoribosyltransferase